MVSNVDEVAGEGERVTLEYEVAPARGRWRRPLGSALGLLLVLAPLCVATIVQRVEVIVVGCVMACLAGAFLWSFRAETGGERTRFGKMWAVMLGLYALAALVEFAAVDRACVRIDPVTPFCAGRMKSIGVALMIYAEDHGGKLPEQLSDLGDLAARNNLKPWCPVGDAQGEGRKAGLGEYVYLGGGKAHTGEFTQVLMYEPLSNHEGKGMNVLFGDGAVRWVDAEKAEAFLGRIDRATASVPKEAMRRIVTELGEGETGGEDGNRNRALDR